MTTWICVNIGFRLKWRPGSVSTLAKGMVCCLTLMRFYDIHMRAISHWVSHLLFWVYFIHMTGMKITLIRMLQHLPEANELLMVAYVMTLYSRMQISLPVYVSNRYCEYTYCLLNLYRVHRLAEPPTKSLLALRSAVTLKTIMYFVSYIS